MKRTKPARGFTMVELLTVIGIVGVLAALLLPAISSVRAAATRAHCAARLKELASACHQYAAAHGRLPPLRTRPGGEASARFSYSWTPHLLPYVEASVAETFNFSTPLPKSSELPETHANGTAHRTRIPAFLCPADFGVAAINYRACSGGDAKLRSVVQDNYLHGAFTFDRHGRKWRDFTDGVSRTALFSERLGGSGNQDYPQPDRDLVLLHGSAIDQALAAGGTSFADACERNSLIETQHFAFMGQAWWAAGLDHCEYQHVSPPNPAYFDCSLGPLDGQTLHGCYAAARSRHSGGVNMALGDGSVQFVGDQIDLAAWRALATIDGGEIASAVQ